MEPSSAVPFSTSSICFLLVGRAMALLVHHFQQFWLQRVVVKLFLRSTHWILAPPSQFQCIIVWRSQLSIYDEYGASCISGNRQKIITSQLLIMHKIISIICEKVVGVWRHTILNMEDSNLSSNKPLLLSTSIWCPKMQFCSNFYPKQQ